MTILAYLDPGSSSMIVQMLLGGVAAAGVALKLYWRRFLRLLRIRKDDETETTPAVQTTANGTGTGTNGTTGANGVANGQAAPAREPAETTKR